MWPAEGALGCGLDCHPLLCQSPPWRSVGALVLSGRACSARGAVGIGWGGGHTPGPPLRQRAAYLRFPLGSPKQPQPCFAPSKVSAVSHVRGAVVSVTVPPGVLQEGRGPRGGPHQERGCGLGMWSCPILRAATLPRLPAASCKSAQALGGLWLLRHQPGLFPWGGQLATALAASETGQNQPAGGAQGPRQALLQTWGWVRAAGGRAWASVGARPRQPLR